jgi:hypothetical protein
MPDHTLAALLPQLVPLAVAWAEQQEVAILRDGRSLEPAERRLAAAVGVADPGRVRLLVVPHVPTPTTRSWPRPARSSASWGRARPA